MRAAVGLTDGLGLDGDRCIRVIPRQDESENKSEVVQPVEPECKIDENDEKEEENESEIVKPVEAEPKVEETEEKPDDSQVEKTEGVLSCKSK